MRWRKSARSLCGDLPVRWHVATGEQTGLQSGRYDLVCFGSSLNVVDSRLALAEAHRLLGPTGALLVMYNHRDLDDPLQAQIEICVRSAVPGFDPGARRSDPQPVVEADGQFRLRSEHRMALVHRSSRQHFIGGFRAHATLIRQAGAALPALLAELDALVRAHADADDQVAIPFNTRLWVAERLA